MIRNLLYKILEISIRANLSIYKPHLKGCRKILDIGSGNGLQAKFINDEMDNIEMICLDLGDYRWEQAKDLENEIYNGIDIPFPNESFDCSLLQLVLHHAEKPEELLKESLRVSNKVLVMEEVYSKRLQKLAMYVYDVLLNFLLFGEKISSPNFLTNSEWLSLFSKLDIGDVEVIKLNRKWWRIPDRIMYVLNR